MALEGVNGPLDKGISMQAVHATRWPWRMTEADARHAKGQSGDRMKTLREMDELGKKAMQNGREMFAMLGIKTYIYCFLCKKAPCECPKQPR